jgi:hypothetical protein
MVEMIGNMFGFLGGISDDGSSGIFKQRQIERLEQEKMSTISGIQMAQQIALANGQTPNYDYCNGYLNGLEKALETLKK